VTTVVSTVTSPFFLGVGTDPYLYFTSGGATVRARRDGTGSSETVSANPPGTLLGVDATSIYFSASDAGAGWSSVVTIPIAGGAMATDFTYSPTGTFLAGPSVVLDGTVLTYTYNGGTGFDVCKNTQTIAVVEAERQVSAYGSCAYFTGGAPLPIYAYGVAVGSDACFAGQVVTTIFAGSSCGILSATSGASPSGVYISAAPGVAGPFLIAPGLANVVNMAADSSAVYWTDATGAIGKLPLP
jgi:hypothetical protein